MNKIVFAQAGLALLVVSSLAVADGPPPGYQLRASFNGVNGTAVSYVGDPKHVDSFKWTGGKATIGIGMGKGMYDWIQSSFDNANKGGGTVGPVKLEMVSTDPAGNIADGILLTDPQITAVTFPPTDASDTNPGAIGINTLTLGANISGNVSAIKLPNQNVPGWLRDKFSIAVTKMPAAKGTSWINVIVPHDPDTGKSTGPINFGSGFHIYFDTSAQAAADAWLKSGAGRSVTITYMSTTGSSLFRLALGGCVPFTQSTSPSRIDVGVTCGSASFAELFE